eukprot:CAMPEP_0175853606 /NCGR_PEP_ID=MMETSP0107_2-20121207/26898_1 /TAXON_ID=195067 ORGANISM="Goniomonas pacifica, Strain CCMP1869" /NCGR_SAMPLE_ID=MMETSP0107_2 /ASSEMBLY_ACC=CAM_ASM_000203 /LENGTH=88 /DNA_ID=CAMNT_0017169343 /DNA_START=370 /DNA_END=636 /DNA_ORIENTATION=+
MLVGFFDQPKRCLAVPEPRQSSASQTKARDNDRRPDGKPLHQRRRLAELDVLRQLNGKGDIENDSECRPQLLIPCQTSKQHMCQWIKL